MQELIELALREDFGDGDVTSEYFVPADLCARALMRPRTKGVLSGVKVAIISTGPERNQTIHLEDPFA